MVSTLANQINIRMGYNNYLNFPDGMNQEQYY